MRRCFFSSSLCKPVSTPTTTLRFFSSQTPILRLRYERKNPADANYSGDLSRTQIHNGIYFNDQHSPAMVPDYDPCFFNINRDIHRLINFVPSDEGSHQSQLFFALFPPEFNFARHSKYEEAVKILAGADGLIPDPVLLTAVAMNSNHEQFTISGRQFYRNEALFEAMEVFLKARETIPPALWFSIGLTVPFLSGITSFDGKKKYPIDCLKNAWIFRDNAHTSSAFEQEPGALYIAHIARALALQEFLDFNLPFEVQRKMAKENNIKLDNDGDKKSSSSYFVRKQDKVPVVGLPMPESHCTHKIVMREYDALTAFEKAWSVVAPHPVDSDEGQRSWFKNLFTARTTIKDEHAAGQLRSSILRGAATVLEMRAARGLDLGEEEEHLNRRMKMLASTEHDPDFIGVMRRFKNYRTGEMFDGEELKELAKFQILDPEAEIQKLKDAERNKKPIEDDSVWNADPFQRFGHLKKNIKI